MAINAAVTLPRWAINAIKDAVGISIATHWPHCFLHFKTFEEGQATRTTEITRSACNDTLRIHEIFGQKNALTQSINDNILKENLSNSSEAPSVMSQY